MKGISGEETLPGIGIRDTVLVAGNVINEIIPGIGFNVRPSTGP
jgi:Fe(3+) dicitrate transport protein